MAAEMTENMLTFQTLKKKCVLLSVIECNLVSTSSLKHGQTSYYTFQIGFDNGQKDLSLLWYVIDNHAENVTNGSHFLISLQNPPPFQQLISVHSFIVFNVSYFNVQHNLSEKQTLKWKIE